MIRRRNQQTNCCQSQPNDCIVLKKSYLKTSLKFLKTMKSRQRLCNMDRIATQQSIAIRHQSPKQTDRTPQISASDRPNIANNESGSRSMAMVSPVVDSPSDLNELRVLSPLQTPFASLSKPGEQENRLQIKLGSYYLSPEWSSTDLTSILKLFPSNKIIS